MKSLLRLDSVSLAYPRAPMVVAALTAEVERGSFICLLGPNGSGKSTLLRCAAGLMAPSTGSVLLGGSPMYGPGALSAKNRAERVAAVLTDPIQPGLLRGWDVVISGRLPYRRLLRRIDEKSKSVAWDALKRVEATHLAKRYLSEVSDGERQRLLLARALAQEPQLLLLDEPAAFLDPPHQAELFLLLKELVESGAVGGALMATHQLSLALDFGEELWLLADGGLEIAAPQVAGPAIDRAFGHERMRFDGTRRSFLPVSTNSGE